MSGELHRIADDLMPDALTEWAVQGVVDLEALLMKHAAFEDYCQRRDDPA